MSEIHGINYKFRDGWHIFTADDMPGLYVASKDACVALESLPKSVQQYEKLTSGPTPAMEKVAEEMRAFIKKVGD